MPRTPSPILEITEDIISNAERRNSAHCMVADTIKVAVPKATFVSVDLQTCRFTLNGMRYIYLTPAQAQAALVNFDQGVPTQPFSVRLRGGQATKSGNRGQRKRDKSKTTRAKITEVGGTITRLGGTAPPTAALHSGPKKLPKGTKKDSITGVGSRRTFGIKHLKL